MTNDIPGIEFLETCDLCGEEYRMSLLEWTGKQWLCLDCRTERND